MERQPVKPEDVEIKRDALNAEPAITRGGDQAATVQSTEGQQVPARAEGESATVTVTVAQGAKGVRGGEPHGPGPEGAPEPAALNYTIPEGVPDHPGKRRTQVKINLDELVIGVQEELKALLQARRTMTWGERELTRLQLTELADVLATLQDQREAHRLIERYFEVLVSNPAAAQKLPGMGALKRIAGGMANAEKAAKGDGRTQGEKGKKKGESILDDLGAAQG